MRNTNLKTGSIVGRRVTTIALLTFALLVIGHSRSSLGQTSQPQSPQRKTFSSPGEAASALFYAVQNKDEQALDATLGAGKDVTSSGDDVQDKLERERFSQKYQEMHRLVREPDGSTTLYIGAENWPFPIPLVTRDGQWYFDSDNGKHEILARRIGADEAAAIQVCEEFATAENDGNAKAAGKGPIAQFIESLVSGGANNNRFEGYYFRVVTVNSATGVSDSKRKGTVTLVAYPAGYRESGVMTFVVTRRGVVYETDLGSKTMTIAPEMKSRTGSHWRPVA
jgi:hypothetical protein